MKWSLLLVLPLLACASLRLRAHDFSGAAQVQELSLNLSPTEPGSLSLHLALKNPSELPAQVVGLRFELSLSGERFATGFLSLDEPLAPSAQRTLQLTLPLVLRAGEGSGEEGGAMAHLEGVALVRFGRLERGMPFQKDAWLFGARALLPAKEVNE